MAKPVRVFFGSAAILAATAIAFGQTSPHKPALDEISGGKTRVIDLSYAISDKMVPWPGDAKAFEAKTNATVEKEGYFTRSFWMLEHYGTHMDAPAHFPPGTTTVDKIAQEKFFGPAVVLDVTKEAERDPDYQLNAKDIAAWEQKNGNIPTGAIVILRTGWSTRWPDAARYRNQDANGKMHFPGFSVEAARILLRRKVNGLGCDTLSIDPGNSPDFPVHHLVLGAGIYQLENLADLSSLPEAGAFLIVAPIKLEGGSGGAVRVFALAGN
ncbi:MAG TPA: cyclase family protein [Candidatus Acidoferrum sp.]|nr:cyclase family protein [Candidatus Acidoferrum sp.]